MARRYYSANANPTTLTAGIGPADTTISVPATTGYPAVPFTIAIARGTAAEEVVLVGAVTSSTFASCTRGYDGTSAGSHIASITVEHVVSAIDYTEIADHLYNTGLDQHTQYLNSSRHAAVSHSSSMIADGAVIASKIAADAVTLAKMADDSVGTEQILDASVTADKFAPGAVGASTLGDNSITTAKYQDGSVSTIKIASGAVTNAKVASGISPSKISDTIAGAGIDYASGVLSVGTSSTIGVDGDDVIVNDSSITSAKLATSAVSTAKIASDAVTGSKIGAGGYRNETSTSTGGAIRYSTAGPSGSGHTNGDLWFRYV